jgi:hypothetical protein
MALLNTVLYMVNKDACGGCSRQAGGLNDSEIGVWIYRILPRFAVTVLVPFFFFSPSRKKKNLILAYEVLTFPCR